MWAPSVVAGGSTVDVALAALNVAQVVGLAWVAAWQARGQRRGRELHAEVREALNGHEGADAAPSTSRRQPPDKLSAVPPLSDRMRGRDRPSHEADAPSERPRLGDRPPPPPRR